MKDLTVKFKNIEYAYRHGLECLVKVATSELNKHLPINESVFIDSERYIIKDNNNNIFIVVGSEGRGWNELSDLEKLEIYNNLFLKF